MYRTSHMQWSKSSGWGMVKCLYTQVAHKVKSMIHRAQFISINCHKANVVDMYTSVFFKGVRKI